MCLEKNANDFMNEKNFILDRLDNLYKKGIRNKELEIHYRLLLIIYSINSNLFIFFLKYLFMIRRRK